LYRLKREGLRADTRVEAAAGQRSSLDANTIKAAEHFQSKVRFFKFHVPQAAHEF